MPSPRSADSSDLDSADPAPAAGNSLQAGHRLGRYELLMPIAQGGMAQVWVARQTGVHGFSRIVALKTILPGHSADGSFQRMFLDEARIAARLRHANVVEVLDLGQDGPVLYLVMPLVDGDSISGLVRRHRAVTKSRALPVGIVARIMADACAGLHAAHQLTDEDGRPLELVHRDVSPHNILVGVDGTSRITDFGIAKAFGRIEQTDVGQVKGKFAYMSPEQVSRKPLDARSDVFSAGIVVWELLSGQRLFAGMDVIDTAERVMGMPIPKLSEVAPGVPVPFSDVCARALRRTKDKRYPTIGAMRDAIEAAARESGTLVGSSDVAEWVSSLVSEDITARRQRIRAFRVEAPPPSSPDPSGTVSGTVSLESFQESVRPRSRAVWLTAMSVIGAVGVGTAFFVLRPAAREPAAAVAPVPSPEREPVSPPTVAPVVTPTPVESSAPPMTQPSSSVTPPSAASSAPAPRPAVPTRAVRPSSKQPKFGNPYGQ